MYSSSDSKVGVEITNLTLMLQFQEAIFFRVALDTYYCIVYDGLDCNCCFIRFFLLNFVEL